MLGAWGALLASLFNAHVRDVVCDVGNHARAHECVDVNGHGCVQVDDHAHVEGCSRVNGNVRTAATARVLPLVSVGVCLHMISLVRRRVCMNLRSLTVCVRSLLGFVTTKLKPMSRWPIGIAMRTVKQIRGLHACV